MTFGFLSSRLTVLVALMVKIYVFAVRVVVLAYRILGFRNCSPGFSL